MSRGPALLTLLAVLVSGCATLSGSPAREREYACGTVFPLEVRHRVGVTEERLSRFGAARDLGSRDVTSQIEARTPALVACALRTRPRSRGVFATFLVDGDGNVLEPIGAVMPPDPVAEACIAREIGRWSLPGLHGKGGLYFAAIRLGPESARVESPPRRGWKGPRFSEGCVFDSHQPLAVEERLAGGVDVVLHLTVRADGRPGDVHAERPIPYGVFWELERGLQACDLEPAWDENGRPHDTWLTLPVRVVALSP